MVKVNNSRQVADVIRQSQGVNMADLIEHTELSRSTIQKVLDRCMSAELIHKVRHGQNFFYFWTIEQGPRRHANDFDPTNPIPTSYRCW